MAPHVVRLGLDLHTRHVDAGRALAPAALAAHAELERAAHLLGVDAVLAQLPGQGQAQGIGASAAPVVARAIVRDVATRAGAVRLLSAAFAYLTALLIITPLLGSGVLALAGWRAVLLGNAAFMAARGLRPDDWQAAPDALAEAGKTSVLVAADGAPAGVLAVADAVRPGARAVIETLHALGLDVAMLTGDAEATARAVAQTVSIDRVAANVLPGDKAEAVRAFQAEGRVVAMVGDGINDAPALAQADVGIAIGTGTDVAIEASDVTLLRDDLAAVPEAVRLARRTLRTIKQNLFFAFVYNVVGIPIAAGALYPVFGLLLSPIIASAAMALSSVSVVTNSLRLRAFRLR